MRCKHTARSAELAVGMPGAATMTAAGVRQGLAPFTTHAAARHRTQVVTRVAQKSTVTCRLRLSCFPLAPLVTWTPPGAFWRPEPVTWPPLGLCGLNPMSETACLGCNPHTFGWFRRPGNGRGGGTWAQTLAPGGAPHWWRQPPGGSPADPPG